MKTFIHLLITTEATVKIIGLRHHYFTTAWNLFDFVLVIASIVGIVMEDLMADFPVSPTLLRVVRVFRIGRILRLIRVSWSCQHCDIAKWKSDKLSSWRQV